MPYAKRKSKELQLNQSYSPVSLVAGLLKKWGNKEKLTFRGIIIKKQYLCYKTMTGKTLYQKI